MSVVIARKRKLPKWHKEVKKKMIDLDMTVNDLAEMIKKTRCYTTSVLNNKNYSENVVNEISDCVGVDANIFYEE